ncbi:hypothetical protein [Desulfosarcina ovata]|uniref:Uncharacterized protein n=1 Tax=Desulfosarcina ovata subsp. ovata TaxID=2752305 RepID=A0A5K8A6C7_9BACT|nr:hypothetical protein [Desulfosarcina ovata]BBO88183.1 hypothetical protein DSCOOX_13630 [Desulfosarcina ovata subsp. ovata]
MKKIIEFFKRQSGDQLPTDTFLKTWQGHKRTFVLSVLKGGETLIRLKITDADEQKQFYMQEGELRKSYEYIMSETSPIESPGFSLFEYRNFTAAIYFFEKVLPELESIPTKVAIAIEDELFRIIPLVLEDVATHNTKFDIDNAKILGRKKRRFAQNRGLRRKSDQRTQAVLNVKKKHPEWKPKYIAEHLIGEWIEAGKNGPKPYAKSKIYDIFKEHGLS